MPDGTVSSSPQSGQLALWKQPVLTSRSTLSQLQPEPREGGDSATQGTLPRILPAKKAASCSVGALSSLGDF